AYAKSFGDRWGADFTYSLGLNLGKDGSVGDVRWDGPAFRAGIGSGATIVAVNGQAYSKSVLEDAIKAAMGGNAPIELLVRDFDRYRTLAVHHHDGSRSHDLRRIEGTPVRRTAFCKAR